MEHCWMTVPQYCAVVGINRCTLRRREMAGKIPPEAVSREPGRHPRVDYARLHPEGYAAMKKLMKEMMK